LGVPGQNDIWVQAPWPGIDNTIRGKVLASSKSELWWVLYSVYAHDSFVHQKCSNYALINLLFGLCRFVWTIDPLFIHPSPHLGALTRRSTLKMLWTKKIPQLLLPLFSPLNLKLSLWKSLGIKYCTLNEPNHLFLNFLRCVFSPLGNQRT
jgi:hypothetical protein